MSICQLIHSYSTQLLLLLQKPLKSQLLYDKLCPGWYSDIHKPFASLFQHIVCPFTLQKTFLLRKTFCETKPCTALLHLLSARPDFVISPQHLAALQPPSLLCFSPIPLTAVP